MKNEKKPRPTNLTCVNYWAIYVDNSNLNNSWLQVIEGMATPVDLNNEEALLQAAATSLNSKVVSQHSTILAPISVQAIRAGQLFW